MGEARVDEKGDRVAILFKETSRSRKILSGYFNLFEYVAVLSRSLCRAIFVTVSSTVQAPKNQMLCLLMSFQNYCLLFELSFPFLVGDFNIQVDNVRWIQYVCLKYSGYLRTFSTYNRSNT